MDTTDKTLAWNLELARELRSYIADTRQELEAARQAASEGEGSREEVVRLEGSLTAAREQLQAVERETRQMVS